MRVLVTNDDGVTAPGLRALAARLAADGHEVQVVAPLKDYSGFSAALGPLHITGRVGYERPAVPGLAGLEVVGVDGPPALCVLSTCLGGFGVKPDLVVSGINAGANTGRAVLHSGTVGAAFTANSFGVPAIAVSQALGEPSHWETAARVAASLAEWMVAHDNPFTLNVNVPNVAPGPLTAQLATLDRGGEVQTAMFESGHGELQLRLPASGPQSGTDTAILESGCIALTPLLAVHTGDVLLDSALAQIEASLSGDGAQRVA